MRVEALWLAFVLALCAAINLQGQNEPSLSSRIVEVLKAKEPAWKPVATVETRVPLVPGEKRILTVAFWKSAKSDSEHVYVSVYGVDNRGEAAAWLGPVHDRRVAVGWQISVYPIGDEGFLAKYKDGKTFEIHFRKGNVVGKIAGNDPQSVSEFTKYIVDEIPPN